jgi:predicted Zn finger-like uncharacterized protein
MKFICPSCKAKYQIADEKVSGRSVRMKCRKCSNVIHIGAPGTAAQMDRTDSLPPRPKGSGLHAAVGAEQPVDAPAEERQPPQEAAAPTARGFAARKPAGPATAAATRRAPAGAATAESPTGAARTMRVQPPSPSPHLQAPPPKSAPKAADAPRRVNRVSRPGEVAPGRDRISQLGSPAQVRLPPRASDPIAGPAVGLVSPLAAPAPVKRSSAQGAKEAKPAATRQPATSDPAVQVPVDYYADDEEATRVADPGALGDAFARVAASPPSSSAVSASAPVEEWFVGIEGSPVGPLRLVELRARAAAGAIRPDSLVWRDGFDAWQPLRKFPELVAIVEESVAEKAAGRRAASSSAPPVAVTQAGRPVQEATSASLAEQEALEEAAGLRRRRSPSRAAWIAVAIGPLFGLTLGFVWFGGRKSAETVVKYVEVPAKAVDRRASTAPEEVLSAEVAAAGPENKGTASRRGAAKSLETAAAPAPAGEKSGGLEGLKGLKALGGTGPKSGPGSTSSEQGGGQPLDASKVQATVSRYTPSVKRSCWNPALDTRDSNAPSSARVTVTITVAASGSVTGVSTTGDPPGYRGLASCIAARVRGWTFPASDGSTTVNVPFVFAAQ